MAVVGFVEELDESVGSVALLLVDFPHVANYYGLEVLANGSEIRIAHHTLHQLIEVVHADLLAGARDHKGPACNRLYLYFRPNWVRLLSEQAGYFAYFLL